MEKDRRKSDDHQAATTEPAGPGASHGSSENHNKAAMAAVSRIAGDGKHAPAPAIDWTQFKNCGEVQQALQKHLPVGSSPDHVCSFNKGQNFFTSGLEGDYVQASTLAARELLSTGRWVMWFRFEAHRLQEIGVDIKYSGL